VHDGKNAKSSCTQRTLCEGCTKLHPLPFYINRQTWMATTGPPERMDWLNKEIRSLVWWVNDPCICLPPAILAHVDCAFLSCPELNQKYCYTWWLHSQPDSWTRLMIWARWYRCQTQIQLLICEDEPVKIQWHCDLTTAQIMRELAQVGWVW